MEPAIDRNSHEFRYSFVRNAGKAARHAGPANQPRVPRVRPLPFGDALQMTNLFPRPVHPGKDDTRSVGELITCALGDPEYDRDGWDAVVALHWRGTEEVLERATMLTRSFCAAE